MTWDRRLLSSSSQMTNSWTLKSIFKGYIGQKGRWMETNLPNIRTDICFLPPDGTTLMEVRRENTDVREVCSHPPKKAIKIYFFE